MATVRNYFDRLFQPLFGFAGIPPPTLFSDPDAFAAAKFPHRESPVLVGDWRDMIVFLSASPTIHSSEMNKRAKKIRGYPQEMYKVVEVGRYTFANAGEDAGGHQVIVAKVEVGDGLCKLLRIERARGVRDLEDDCRAELLKIRTGFPRALMRRWSTRKATDEEMADDPVSGSCPGSPASDAIQEVLRTPPVPGSRPGSPASAAIQQILRTPVPELVQNPVPIGPTSPHPSISIYTINVLGQVKQDVKSDKNGKSKAVSVSQPPLSTPNIDVDTVQTIFESDLRALVLMESVQPNDLYLHHLAMLVGEVHEYYPRQSRAPPLVPGPHHCTLFTQMVMSVLTNETGAIPTTMGPAADTDTDSSVEEGVVDEIVSSYRVIKDDVRRRIAKAVGDPPLAEKQRQPETQDEPLKELKIKQEVHEHIEVAEVHV